MGRKTCLAAGQRGVSDALFARMLRGGCIGLFCVISPYGSRAPRPTAPVNLEGARRWDAGIRAPSPRAQSPYAGPTSGRNYAPSSDAVSYDWLLPTEGDLVRAYRKVAISADKEGAPRPTRLNTPRVQSRYERLKDAITPPTQCWGSRIALPDGGRRATQANVGIRNRTRYRRLVSSRAIGNYCALNLSCKRPFTRQSLPLLRRGA